MSVLPVIRNKFYYSIKPFTPPGVRLAVRRWYSKRKRLQTTDSWPVVPGSEVKPEGWKGWPGGKQFGLILTHDVESEVGLHHCPKVMEMEQKLGFRSSFNFIPEGGYRVGSNLRKELVASGFEVGIHDLNHDGRLYQSRRTFSRKAERINHYLAEWEAVGFRSGFMLNELTWLHELNIAYDASTFDTDPFEPQPDGRDTIFPFWVPRPANFASQVTQPHRRRGYLELPYTLPQDSTIFLLLQEEGPDVWLHKLDWIAKHGGMALINVHPDYLGFSGHPSAARSYAPEHYRTFLEYVRDRYAGAYVNLLPRELTGHLPPPEPAAPPTSPQGPVASVKSPVKRVCVIRHGHYPQDPRVRKEVAAMLECGHEVDVLCLQYDDSQPIHENEGRLNIRRLGVRHVRGSILRYFWEYGASFVLFGGLATMRHLGRRYDVVQVNTMPDFLVFCTALLKLAGARVVADFHEPTPELWVTKYGRKNLPLLWMQELIMSSAIRFADRSFTVTEALRRKLVDRSGRADIMVCPNSTQLSFGRDVPVEQIYSDDTFVVMTHGLIEERYGHQLVIDAVRRLADRIPQLRYEIIGQGEYAPQLQAYIDEHQCGHLISLRGFLPFDELVNRIRGASIGIIPMRRSPYSELVDTNKMYEYMLLGVPVIHARLPAVEAGFGEDSIEYFASDDSADLEQAILRLYQNPERRRQLAEQARMVSEKTAWDNVKAAYVGALVGENN